MYCVGGPADGKFIKTDMWEIRIPLETSTNRRIPPDGQQPDEYKANWATYRVEVVLLAWGKSAGQFNCRALVHESITDREQINRAVLGAFFAAMLVGAESCSGRIPE